MTMIYLDDTNSCRNTNSNNCCPSNYLPNHYYHHQHNSNSNYLNCAAPKSVLTHNCQMIRQIQRDYPPYPSDVGVYYLANNAQSQPYYAAQYPMQSTPPQCSSPQQLRPNAFDPNAKTKGPKHPGILKNYKSCPVSPVHEEIDWSTMKTPTTTTTATAADGSHHHQPHQNRRHEAIDPKHRHSMYSDGDDAKTILDMIHADTEKMIAEITQKYGDIDIDIDTPNRNSGNNNDEDALHGDDEDNNDDDDDGGSMSSDSLEDCSLDLDCIGRCNNVRRRKTVCKKKHRKNEPISMMPTRSVSDYFIYDEFYLNRNRNVSLSDILNDDADKPKPNYAFLNSQRHSSASFFLAPERKSQESLISDDMSGCGGVSYCNSMESILSDESECKSAPLEALFTKTKRDIISRTSNIMCDGGRFDAQPMTSSKSYGSSPNSNVFDYFMDQQCRAAYGFQERDACNIANYDYDCLLMSANTSARTSNRCSPLPPPPPEFQNIIAKPMTGIPNSCTFPSMSGLTYQSRNSEDFIPRFASKNDQYSSQTNKSLSKEFATERQIRNSNPLYVEVAAAPITACHGDDDSDLFQRKPIKPAIPAKPSKLMEIAIKPLPSTSAAAKPIDECTSTPSNIKRSCSFEIEMFHNRGRVLQQKNAAKKYEQNLQKFEKEHRHRMRTTNAQLGGTLEMPYVPHKPPVANRRSSSMKSKKGAKHTKDHAKMNEPKSPSRVEVEKKKCQSAKKDESENDEQDEKTIEIFISEKAVCDDDNMDSLDLYMKPKLYKENSVDSLDGIPVKNRSKSSASDAPADQQSDDTMVSLDFLSKADATKFRDIEKKIDVINKLVELEEKKLVQERCAKELRMRPFTCNPKEKGYVRSLTLNFDNLAKSIKYERELSLRLKEQNEMRRNHSLPDVLEDTKYRFKCGFNERRQRSTDTYLDGYGRVEGVGL